MKTDQIRFSDAVSSEQMNGFLTKLAQEHCWEEAQS